MARLVLLLAALTLPFAGAAPTDALAKKPAKQKKAAAKRTCAPKKKTKGKRAKKTTCKAVKKKKAPLKRKAAPRPKLPAAPPAPAAAAPAPGGGGSTAPSSDAPAPPPPPPPPPGDDPVPAFDFKTPPNPVHVDPAKDAGRAKSAYIDWMGGTVEATGADGAHYRLTIPEGALAFETKITVTPLTKVEGLPFSGGLRSGAELSPSGLRFIKPVTFEITGGKAIDPALETGFAYHGDGKDLHLAPMVKNPHVHGFSLLHFSAYGIAHGTNAERQAQLVRTTQGVERQLEQILSRELAHDRQHQLGLPGGAPGRPEIINAALEAYHDQIVKPLLDDAVTDDALVGRALNRALAWERQTELMAGSDFLRAKRDALYAAIQKVMTNASERSYARCMAGHLEEIPVLLSWERQFQLMGWEVPSLDLRLRKCARMELDFETDIRQTVGFPMPEGFEKWRGHLKADKILLKLEDKFRMSGADWFDYDLFEIDVPPHQPGTGCWNGSDEWESRGAMGASDVHAEWNWLEDVDGDEFQLPSVDIADWRVRMFPLQTKEHIYKSDCGGGTGSGGWTTWLGLVWDDLHKDKSRPMDPVDLTGWQPAGVGTWKLTFKRGVTLGGVPTTEDTTVVLRHVPDPNAT